MKNFYVWFVSFTSALGGFLFGFEIGIINTILSMPPFLLYFGLAEKDSEGNIVNTGRKEDIEGWIVSIFTIGCIVGSMMVSYLADKIGRRRSIISGAFIFGIGGIIQAISWNIPVIYIGRFVSGLSVGILSSVVPLYISEVAPQEIRGSVITVQQFMITVGIFISAIVNSIFYFKVHGDLKWRLALGFQAIPGFLLFLMMLPLPASSRWLVAQGRSSEALNSIKRLRNRDINTAIVQNEYEEIRAGVELEAQIGSASWREMLRTVSVRKRLLIIIILQCFQQFTGINAIMYYSSQIYRAAGFSNDFSATFLVIITNFVNVVGTLPGMYFVDKSGRKKLLIIGGFGMFLSQILVCIFSGLARHGSSEGGYLTLFSIYSFIFFFASTWGPVVWVYQSEIFPLRFRSKGTASGTISNWVSNAIIGKTVPLLFRGINQFVYLIFAAFCIAMAIFSFTLKETKGLSLEEMELLFASKNPSLKSFSLAPKDASFDGVTMTENETRVAQPNDEIVLAGVSPSESDRELL